MIVKKMTSALLLIALLAATACGSQPNDAETTASDSDTTTQPEETVDERYQIKEELHEKPFSILMRLEKNEQRNTDHNHTKYRNHEQER